MNELEQKALDLLKEGEYEKAAKIYLQLAVSEASQAKFLSAAAGCYDRLGDKKIALQLYKKALIANPQSVLTMVNMATLYYENKQYDKTVEISQKVLEIEPNNFAALMNLGNAHYALGQYQEALSAYEKMYEINPNSYNAIINIANTCYNLSEFIKAIEFASMAVEKRPTSAEGYIVAGNAYIELSKNNEATQFLKKAAEIDPNSDWLCNSLANLFQKMGNWKQCLHYAWKNFTLKGERVSIDDHINFAYFLYEAMDEPHDKVQDEIIHKYMENWEKQFPGNPVVHHACSALRNEQNVSQMDLSYVRGLFDGFAVSFDSILRDLDYKVPTLIAEVLKDNLKTNLFKKRRILDLGCGTGLCAEALKEYYPDEEFYGVDISERMLDEAGKKDIYKELYAADIESFLDTSEEVFHAVVAGDVLTYMGELKPIFRKLTRVLKFNGFFAFSISKNTFNNNDYFLVPSGRFVHTISYVQRLLKYCGFKTVSVNETMLRHEGAKEVMGYIIVAQKEIEVVFE